MKVENMTSASGNKVANQFRIVDVTFILDVYGTVHGALFQSYDSLIVLRAHSGKVYLDTNKWNYSRTTGKYRNQFLGESKKETQAKIDSGEYILTNLN